VKKKADAAEAAIAKAADERLTAEFVAKAAKFDGLPGVTADTFGPVLKRVLGGADEGDREAVLSALAKASDAAKKALTVSIGEAGRVEKSDAEAELDAKAHEIAKRDGITFAKAYTKAMHENPALYERFLAKN
jgi:23S rRNA G2069 N7-methylase RlmK/C1962 C5-methylase RlmI